MAKSPGELMRAARKRSGKNQADIAEELGVTQPCVFSWESDKTSPRTADLSRVAKAYGLKPQQLIPRKAAS